MILERFFACSDAFIWWLCGSTSCIMMFFSFKYFLNALEATLSMMLKTGLKPPFVQYVMFSLNVAIVDSYFKYFTGVARIALDYQS